jgi:hypothetical protein
MEKDLQQFDDIAAKLKSELSLQTDEEFYRSALKESHDIYEHLQKEYQKGLDEIELTENDLGLLDYVKERLPHSFWWLNDLSEFKFSGDSLVSIKEYNYWYIDDFIQALCKGGWDGEIMCEGGRDGKIRVDESPRNKFVEEWSDSLNEEKLEDVLMLVGSLIKGRYCCEKEALMRKIIDDQPHQNKIVIMKFILSNTDGDYMYWWHNMCFNILKDSWWDDTLIPIVEGYKGDAREDYRASVIALRFPFDYVLEPRHRQDLEFYDYESVCCRLAREKGFVIDKSKMERLRYFRILALNHIHVEDSEADRLLFEHIGLWLLSGWRHLSKKDTIDWSRFIRLDSDRVKYKDVLPLWFRYKPSLYEIPLVKTYAFYLCSMGNTNTLAKLITWDHFLRSNINNMIEENGQEMLKVEHVPDAFVDNMDRMWKRFLELAIETCPIEKDQIEQVFKGSGVDDYVGEFEACDRQFE